VSYQIEITREALRALAKLDKPVRRRLQIAIDGLLNDPHPNGSIALQGLRGAFRVRVGDYRVIYTVEDGRLLVSSSTLGTDARSTRPMSGGSIDLRRRLLGPGKMVCELR
jgi:mRNA interferase RelE/StbE